MVTCISKTKQENLNLMTDGKLVMGWAWVGDSKSKPTEKNALAAAELPRQKKNKSTVLTV
jgi:hypothetical protein